MDPSKSNYKLTKNGIKALKARVKKIKDSDDVRKVSLNVEDLALLLSLDEAGAQNVLDAFDTDQNGTVEWEELCEGIKAMSASNSISERARYLFNLWDSDGNGTLDREEARRMFRTVIFATAAMMTSEMTIDLMKEMDKQSRIDTRSRGYLERVGVEIDRSISEKDVDSLSKMLFDQIDLDGNGTIELEEFVTHMASGTSSLNPLLESIGRLLIPSKEDKRCRMF